LVFLVYRAIFKKLKTPLARQRLDGSSKFQREENRHAQKPSRGGSPPFDQDFTPKTMNWPKIGRKMTENSDISETASLTPVEKAGNVIGDPRDV
jgi:hypothetical protein